jgi:hypothetical protein
MQIQVIKLGEYDRCLTLNKIYQVVDINEDKGQDFLTIVNDINQKSSIFKDQCQSINDASILSICDSLLQWVHDFPYTLKVNDVVQKVERLRKKQERDLVMAFEMGRNTLKYQNGEEFYNTLFTTRKKKNGTRKTK